ncbi:energy transducer TonB [Thiohalorhabdus sp. Cl-TMA]|uniref:Protein TonB n=1 Tax=Thiohalorhabdus methylotrophus TaxID=3242694 RepID=A0ABV4TRW9_9GAMM
MAHTHPLRNYASATGFMVLGTALVLGTVLLINAYNKGPDKKEVEDTARFNVAPPEPPKQEQVEPEPEPEQEPQANNPPPSPLQGLGTSVGAGSFEIATPDFGGNAGGLDDSLLGDTRDVVMTDDSVDVPPKAVERAAMQYPAAARQKGITGFVTVNLLVNAEGRVEKVKVLDSKPGGVFEEAAVEAVRAWRFEPAKYEGEAVKVWAKQKIRFNLS